MNSDEDAAPVLNINLTGLYMKIHDEQVGRLVWVSEERSRRRTRRKRSYGNGSGRQQKKGKTKHEMERLYKWRHEGTEHSQ